MSELETLEAVKKLGEAFRDLDDLFEQIFEDARDHEKRPLNRFLH